MKAARVFKDRVTHVTSVRFRDRREARVALIIGVHTAQAREYIWQRVMGHLRIAQLPEPPKGWRGKRSSYWHAQRATHWLNVITAFDRGEPIP